MLQVLSLQPQGCCLNNPHIPDINQRDRFEGLEDFWKAYQHHEVCMLPAQSLVFDARWVLQYVAQSDKLHKEAVLCPLAHACLGVKVNERGYVHCAGGISGPAQGRCSR